MAKAKSAAVDVDLLDKFLEGQDPATVLNAGGLLGDHKKALAEQMLKIEMDAHLNSDVGKQAGNHFNGSGLSTV